MHTFPAARMLTGLGVIGSMLEQGEQALPDIRAALLRHGFTSNQISLLFDALRSERIRGVTVKVRQTGHTSYWSLTGVVVRL